MSRGVARGRRGRRESRGVAGSGSSGTAMAAATAASQQLSHLAGALDDHAQGPNIPFGVNPSLRSHKKIIRMDHMDHLGFPHKINFDM